MNITTRIKNIKYNTKGKTKVKRQKKMKRKIWIPLQRHPSIHGKNINKLLQIKNTILKTKQKQNDKKE